MEYLFVQRNSKTGASSVVATLTDKLAWSGSSAERIKELLSRNQRFPGGFDENNADHRKLLPQAISGDYLWVREEA